MATPSRAEAIKAASIRVDATRELLTLSLERMMHDRSDDAIQKHVVAIAAWTDAQTVLLKATAARR
jgi:hypothetical protein